jgi:hypothetical protein
MINLLPKLIFSFGIISSSLVAATTHTLAATPIPVTRQQWTQELGISPSCNAYRSYWNQSLGDGISLTKINSNVSLVAVKCASTIFGNLKYEIEYYVFNSQSRTSRQLTFDHFDGVKLVKTTRIWGIDVVLPAKVINGLVTLININSDVTDNTVGVKHVYTFRPDTSAVTVLTRQWSNPNLSPKPTIRKPISLWKLDYSWNPPVVVIEPGPAF